MTPLFWLLASMVVAAVLVVVALRLALTHRQRLPMDVANGRSLHVGAVPRIGGAAMVPAVLAAAAVQAIAGVGASGPPVTTAIAALALAALSFADDWRPLAVVVRLAGHVAAALAVVAGLEIPWPAAVAVCLLLVWATNLYNFMDGSDGLAGVMTVIGFGTYALAAWPGLPGLAGLAAVVAAAAAGFMVFNVSPARVFLGDAGSIPLGFLAGALGVLGWHSGIWPAWFPALVFLPFAADATVTLARRLLAGERVWQAHRDHCYQRLIRLGWSHGRLAAAEATLMLCCAGSALAALSASPAVQAGLLAFWCLASGGLLVWCELLWRRRAPEQRNLP